MVVLLMLAYAKEHGYTDTTDNVIKNVNQETSAKTLKTGRTGKKLNLKLRKRN